ncbi:hypothetical protein C8J57DRAFT_1237756 [Mycena rebaudengoi]|nr:hypothetical protein C8J57DRAFT_1237756 [Mycena rebaudengoi]
MPEIATGFVGATATLHIWLPSEPDIHQDSSRSQVFASRSAGTMKDLAFLAKDASVIAVIAIALSQLLSKPSDTPKDLAMVTAQAEKRIWQKSQMQTGDFGQPNLIRSQHLSILPTPTLYMFLDYLHRTCSTFHNVLLPRLPGIIYESMVDHLACVFLGDYLPTSHQFLLQPQHTFRRIVPEKSDSLQADWSTISNDGDGSSVSFQVMLQYNNPQRKQRTDLSANTEVVFPEHNLQSGERDTSFLALAKSHEPNLDFLLGIPKASSSPSRRFTIPKPRGDGPSKVVGTGLDTNDQFVDTSPSGLRKPDISILYQGIPSQSDSKIVQHYPGLESAVLAVEVPVGMGESKLRDQVAVVRQLIRYTKDFSREVSPEMRFFAFTLHGSGLEVAMY